MTVPMSALTATRDVALADGTDAAAKAIVGDDALHALTEYA